MARAAIEVARRWLERWCFGGVPLELGGALTIHPCREAEDVWSPHFNVLVPLIGLLNDGAARKGRYRVPKEALDDLRERWTDELRRFGWEPRWKPQVFYRFRLDVPRKLHAARYFARSWPNWSPHTQRVSYFGILRRGVSPLEGAEPETWPKPDGLGLCVKCGAPMIPVERVGPNRWEVWDGDVWRARDGPPTDPRVFMAWNPDAGRSHGATDGRPVEELGNGEGRNGQCWIDSCLGVLGRES